MQIERFPYGDESRTGHVRPVPLPINVRQIAAYLALPLSYFIGAKIEFALTAYPQPISMLWPPNAILLAALLLTPKSHWPVLIALVFPAHLAAELGAHV